MSSGNNGKPPPSNFLGMTAGGDVDEEQPELRAVKLDSSPAFQVRTDLDLGFGKTPPLGISRPDSIARKRSSSIAVKQVWNEVNWKVNDPLEQVPLDFPLERTHREIVGASASEVARRISTALQLLSVDAKYDGPKAKAKCKTSDSVSFRIRLFAGGEDGLPVVVEVQLRSGPAHSFMRVCRKILDAAEGAEINAELETPMKKLPPFVKGPIGGMKCLQGVKNVDADSQLKGSLAKALELIRAKGKDCNLLGLENLCQLTDPLKTRPDIALKACKAILLDEECTDIREEIGNLLQKDTFHPQDVDSEGAVDLQEQARHLSLVLISNTLVLTSKDGFLAEAVKREKWFCEFLIPSLLDEVRSFDSSCNNAYEASCGLTSLATCSDIARRVMEENDAVDNFQSAHLYGVRFHELLANESERALQALGKSL